MKNRDLNSALHSLWKLATSLVAKFQMCTAHKGTQEDTHLPEAHNSNQTAQAGHISSVEVQEAEELIALGEAEGAKAHKHTIIRSPPPLVPLNVFVSTQAPLARCQCSS